MKKLSVVKYFIENPLTFAIRWSMNKQLLQCEIWTNICYTWVYEQTFATLWSMKNNNYNTVVYEQTISTSLCLEESQVWLQIGNLILAELGYFLDENIVLLN